MGTMPECALVHIDTRGKLRPVSSEGGPEWGGRGLPFTGSYSEVASAKERGAMRTPTLNLAIVKANLVLDIKTTNPSPLWRARGKDHEIPDDHTHVLAYYQSGAREFLPASNEGLTIGTPFTGTRRAVEARKQELSTMYPADNFVVAEIAAVFTPVTSPATTELIWKGGQL